MVEAAIRQAIEDVATQCPGITVDIRRILLAHSMKPLPGNKPLVEAIQKHGQAVFGQAIPARGTPLYTDVRLYAAAGIPGVITAPARAPCWSRMPSAPTSGSTWKTCAARPR